MMRKVAKMMRKNKRFLGGLIGVCLTLPIGAMAAPGEAGFDLLRRDLNAASVAVGSATVGFPQIATFGSNPAALAEKNSMMGGAGYIDDPMDLKAGNFFYSQPWREYTVAARLTYYDYGSFDRTSVTGEKLGTFGANDIFVAVAAARKFNEVTVGIEPGYILSKIDGYSASAMTFSAGIQYTPSFLQLTRIGVDVRNLGTNVKKYASSTTQLPTEVRIGFSKKLEHLPFTILVQANKWRDTDWNLNAGGEFEIAAPFRLRVGYTTLGKDQKSNSTSESIAGISGGFGLSYSDYLFDFAYAMQGSIGDRIYLQFAWVPPLAK